MSDSTGTLERSHSVNHPLQHRRGWRVACIGAGVVTLGLAAACSGGSGTATKPAPGQGTESAAPTEVSTTSLVPGTSAAPRPRSSAVGGAPTSRPGERLTDSSRLRLDGIGAIDVGMTLEEASAATGMHVRIVSEDFGTGCRYAEAEGGPAGLSFMVVGGRIVRIDVIGTHKPSPIKTLSGISVGSTEEQVMAAYPGRIKVMANDYVETYHDLVYTSSDPALGLIFVTDGARVTSFRSGQAAPVSAIEGCS